MSNELGIPSWNHQHQRLRIWSDIVHSEVSKMCLNQKLKLVDRNPIMS